MVESQKSVPEQSSPDPNQLSIWRRTPPLVLPMLVLSCGLVVAGAVAVKGIRTATDTVTVTGASTERLRSDYACLLYTSPSSRDGLLSRMPSSA